MFDISTTRRAADPAALPSGGADGGFAGHPWLAALAAQPTIEDCADLLWMLLPLHGPPDLVSIVAELNPHPQANDWLAAAVDGFTAERAFVARLSAGAGAPPMMAVESTQAALRAQRDVLEALARSDRLGCAIGAVWGLLVDWTALRPVLEAVATRLGVTAATSAMLPGDTDHRAILAKLPDRPWRDRGLLFGARQLRLLHSGLLDLAQARAEARRELRRSAPPQHALDAGIGHDPA